MLNNLLAINCFSSEENDKQGDRKCKPTFNMMQTFQEIK